MPFETQPDLGGEWGLVGRRPAPSARVQRHLAGRLRLPGERRCTSSRAGNRLATNYGGDLRSFGGGSARLRPDGTIVPRNSLFGPAQNRTVLRFQQRIPLPGGSSIDGIAEVFNLFNRTNYSSATRKARRLSAADHRAVPLGAVRVPVDVSEAGQAHVGSRAQRNGLQLPVEQADPATSASSFRGIAFAMQSITMKRSGTRPRACRCRRRVYSKARRATFPRALPRRISRSSATARPTDVRASRWRSARSAAAGTCTWAISGTAGWTIMDVTDPAKPQVLKFVAGTGEHVVDPDGSPRQHHDHRPGAGVAPVGRRSVEAARRRAS